jgi:hypothetical protein
MCLWDRERAKCKCRRLYVQKSKSYDKKNDQYEVQSLSMICVYLRHKGSLKK